MHFVATEKHIELTREQLIELYRMMYRAREVERVADIWFRQGHAHFTISGKGHEAFLAGINLWMQPGKDFYLLHYRDMVTALAAGMTPRELLASFLGSSEAEDSGRGRLLPQHYGSRRCNIPTTSSPVGTQFLPAVGMAFATLYKSKIEGLRGTTDWSSDEIVYVACGEGTAAQGEFFEALNFAAMDAHPCPVLFVVEDNGYAISTPPEFECAALSPISLLQGFENAGVLLIDVNGLDVVESAQAAHTAISYVRANRRPAVIRGKVVRLGGHSSDDPWDLYISRERRADLLALDPLPLARQALVDRDIDDAEIGAIEAAVREELEEARGYFDDQLSNGRVILPSPGTETDHLYPPVDWAAPQFLTSCKTSGEPLTILRAINRCLHAAMARDPRIFVFGEDVWDAPEHFLEHVQGKGGVFGGKSGGVTAGLQKTFGLMRCLPSPLAEATIAGISVGAALRGLIPIGEIQFGDYVGPALNQIYNEMATMCWRSQGTWPLHMILRVASQSYVHGLGGPWHAQSEEALYIWPGLYVVIPSNAEDAVGLLNAALLCNGPVMFLEPKALYRVHDPGIAMSYPGDDYAIPFGKARVAFDTGGISDAGGVTLVTWGIPVHKACTVAKKLRGTIPVRVIDLRTLQPWDREAVFASVRETSRVLVVQGAREVMGFGAEIVREISEHCFDHLDAPPKVLGATNTFVPYGPLEDHLLPQEDDIETAIRQLMAF